MSSNKNSNLDFNWNQHYIQAPAHKNDYLEPSVNQIQDVSILSEDLRDGFHGVHLSPVVERVIPYIEKLYQIGIRHIRAGIYSGKGNALDVKTQKLLSILYKKYPDIIPSILSVTSEDSIRWAADCAKINPNLQTLIFMGSSPSRMIAEGWDEPYILDSMKRGFSMAREYGLKIIGATEHTTQTHPDFLAKILDVQTKSARKNMQVFCIADTIGTARPKGVKNIVLWTKKYLKKIKRQDILIEWHGHEDTGNSSANSLVAVSAGAKIIDTVSYGIGERAGNTKMESVLINLNNILEDNNIQSKWKLEYLNSALTDYCNLVKMDVPRIGMLGWNAFKTSLGIHTAAIYKLVQLANSAATVDEKHEYIKMSHHVYSGIGPEKVGRYTDVRISPYSGKSTVKYYLERHGISTTSIQDKCIRRVLDLAKNMGRELTHDEIIQVLTQCV